MHLVSLALHLGQAVAVFGQPGGGRGGIYPVDALVQAALGKQLNAFVEHVLGVDVLLQFLLELGAFLPALDAELGEDVLSAGEQAQGIRIAPQARRRLGFTKSGSGFGGQRHGRDIARAQVAFGLGAVLAGPFPARLNRQHLIVDLDRLGVTPAVEQGLGFFQLLGSIGVVDTLFGSGWFVVAGSAGRGRRSVFSRGQVLTQRHRGRFHAAQLVAQILVELLDFGALHLSQGLKVGGMNQVVQIDHQAAQVGRGGTFTLEQLTGFSYQGFMITRHKVMLLQCHIGVEQILTQIGRRLISSA